MSIQSGLELLQNRRVNQHLQVLVVASDLSLERRLRSLGFEFGEQYVHMAAGAVQDGLGLPPDMKLGAESHGGGRVSVVDTYGVTRVELEVTIGGDDVIVRIHPVHVTLDDAIKSLNVRPTPSQGETLEIVVVNDQPSIVAIHVGLQVTPYRLSSPGGFDIFTWTGHRIAQIWRLNHAVTVSVPEETDLTVRPEDMVFLDGGGIAEYVLVWYLLAIPRVKRTSGLLHSNADVLRHAGLDVSKQDPVTQWRLSGSAIEGKQYRFVRKL